MAGAEFGYKEEQKFSKLRQKQKDKAPRKLLIVTNRGNSAEEPVKEVPGDIDYNNLIPRKDSLVNQLLQYKFTQESKAEIEEKERQNYLTKKFLAPKAQNNQFYLNNAFLRRKEVVQAQIQDFKEQRAKSRT